MRQREVIPPATSLWPKAVVTLTPEEQAVKDDVLLELQQWGYTGLLGWVQTQGHKVAEQLSQVRGHKADDSSFRSLEVGCGSGYHFRFVPQGIHVGFDYSESQLRRAQQHYPHARLVQSDAYQLPFRQHAFDRVVSIYVFEHLHRLPASLEEIRRVLKPGGELLVGLPAEGGLVYEWGRRFTTQRHFQQKYGIDYARLVQSEHCSTAAEVIDELQRWFSVERIQYLPLRVPTIHLNAIVVLRCTKGDGPKE